MHVFIFLLSALVICLIPFFTPFLDFASLGVICLNRPLAMIYVSSMIIKG